MSTSLGGLKDSNEFMVAIISISLASKIGLCRVDAPTEPKTLPQSKLKVNFHFGQAIIG